MPTVPFIKLNNGLNCPALGLGTWQAVEGEAETAIKEAISVGYRHIDTAMLYSNEREIGRAIRAKIQDGSVKREDLFIVTKIWNTFHEFEKVVPTCKMSLENLGLDYIDLYLIHWPVALQPMEGFNVSFPFKNVKGLDYDYVDTWRGMEECVKLGLVKSIGLSNFNSKQVQRILDNATIKPAMNQIEVTPSLNQKPLIEFCRKREIAITAYSPFGSPTRPWARSGDTVFSLQDDRLAKIGAKYSKSPAQVVLKYIIQGGCIPIPKSSNIKRMKENIGVFDFELTQEDLDILDSFNCNVRAVHAEEMKGMPHYPFENADF